MSQQLLWHALTSMLQHVAELGVRHLSEEAAAKGFESPPVDAFLETGISL